MGIALVATNPTIPYFLHSQSNVLSGLRRPAIKVSYCGFTFQLEKMYSFNSRGITTPDSASPARASTTRVDGALEFKSNKGSSDA